MKKIKSVYTIFLVIILLEIINTTLITPTTIDKDKNIHNSSQIDEHYLNLYTSQEFELSVEFEPSTYFISPGSSFGKDDGVYFTFMANKNGNYTLDVKNFPNALTQSVPAETYIAFDNPSGTDLFYLSFVEFDLEFFGEIKIKIFKSEDCGKNWKVETVATFPTQAKNFIELFNYIKGTAIAANPSVGLIGVITFINNSELVYIHSIDNGTTWETPIIIVNATQIGMLPLPPFPNIEIAILENGTVYVLSETANPNFTDIVYFESHNNGTLGSWSGPKNITILNNLICYKPKLQVDYTSGEFYLAWRVNTYPVHISWAQFTPTQSLSSNIPIANVSDNLEGNFDFILDNKQGCFRLIQVYGSFGQPVKVNEWNTTNFETPWTSNSLEIIEDYASEVSGNLDFNIAHDGEKYQFFYGANYMGTPDIHQYLYFKNATFYTDKGEFIRNTLKQIFWDGKINKTTPIPTSKVKIEFCAQDDIAKTINRTTYISIDNIYPQLDYFNQESNYFNPLASNISFSNIIWNLRSSEECYVNLEIFRETIDQSNWTRLTDDNWDDTTPDIFLSNKGQLYILYQTIEAGRKIIYLRKSFDKGITWTNPSVLYQAIAETDTIYYKGAAWGDFVSVLIKVGLKTKDHFLYRSFDQGITFQDPINLTQIGFLPPISSTDIISDIVFTNNGTLYLTLLSTSTEHDQFYVFKSDNLGINWTISEKWINYNELTDWSSWNSKLVYDSLNELLFICMSENNITESFSGEAWANFSFSVLNLSTNLWSQPQSTGLIKVSHSSSVPDLLITRNTPSSPLIVRAVFQYDLDLTQGYMRKIIKEFNYSYLDQTWNGPYESSITTVTAASDFDEIYYTDVFSDGNDREIYLSREGRLVKFKRYSISSHQITEYTFDGTDDFGEMIGEGHYTYNLFLKDYAGNTFNYSGWFYVDYNAPLITNIATNWTVAPVPRNDVGIMVNITENTNCTTYLYYKKDLGTWRVIPMSNYSGNIYSATIPGDSQTKLIQYYVKSTDLAGNVFVLDNAGSFYTYNIPNFFWESDGLFKESNSYSSSKDYEITIEITDDLEYVDKVIFRYSYDEGDEWEDLELEQNSPEFSGKLDDIPGDLRTLQYKVIVIDVYGTEYELTDTREIEFYPEVPSIIFKEGDVALIIIISAIVGIIVGIGYIKLKRTSHETLYKKVFLKEYIKKKEISKKITNEISIKKFFRRFKKESDENQLENSKELKSITSFTKVYLGVLCGTTSVFSIALLFSIMTPTVGMLILSASLLMSVFGYMILMSRDITNTVYFERIHLKNIALEIFQIFFMFINIIAILLVGFTIDWFRYYLIESTYDFGSTSIPRLYISIFAVFFTSLVLVGITTYIQLRKTVINLHQQSLQGASPNLLLYLKDQNSSRLITRLGYKTIIFLVTILLAVVTTTNLLTEDTGRALLIIIIPFALASFLTLMIHRYFEMRTKRKEKDIQLPFSDSKKFCNKCGEPLYLSNKFCAACGSQQIFEDIYGTYISRCQHCNSFINDKAKFCTECGKKTLK